MRKLVVWSSIAVLLFASANAFAGFSFKRIKRIKVGNVTLRAKGRNVLVADSPTMIRRIKVGGKTFRVKSYKVRQPNKGPRAIRPSQSAHTAAIAARVERAVTRAEQARVKPLTSEEKAFLADLWKENGGKMVYDDQAKLVQDVVSFYENQGLAGQRIEGPYGHEVLRYDLPADGIVFYRPGYNNRRVLNTENYFIMYDPANHYGQIVVAK